MLSNKNSALKIGHDLITQHFLDCIETTRSEAEVDDIFHKRQKLAKKEADDKKDKKEEARKAKETKEQRKKNQAR